LTDKRRAEIEAVQETLVIALMESVDFGDIVAHIDAVEPALLRPKIKDVLQGPYLPNDENNTSNRSRNILFELSLAAKLRQAGFQPILGEHPDLVCEVMGRKVGFECKRPFSLARVPDRIQQAEGQLRRDLGDLRKFSPNARGIVAISLSRVFNPYNKLFVHSTEKSGREGLERLVSGIVDEFKPMWNALRDPIIGTLFHVVTPAFNRDAGVYILGQQIVGASVAIRGSSDDRLCVDFAQALAKTAH
jgi:hypothetical protein